MKENRHLEDYVNKKYFFVGDYVGYHNGAYVVKNVKFKNDKGEFVKVDHFNIYTRQFNSTSSKFKKSDLRKQVAFYGVIDTYKHNIKENGIDFCVRDVIVIR